MFYLIGEVDYLFLTCLILCFRISSYLTMFGPFYLRNGSVRHFKCWVRRESSWEPIDTSIYLKLFSFEWRVYGTVSFLSLVGTAVQYTPPSIANTPQVCGTHHKGCHCHSELMPGSPLTRFFLETQSLIIIEVIYCDDLNDGRKSHCGKAPHSIS